MANMPAAEVQVTRNLVQRLIAEQHPDLAGEPLTLVANGWDNAIFRLGRNLAVRLPRREAAASLIRNEQLWLPQLSRGLPAVTPLPLRTGAPSSYYPWHWTIAAWIEGTPAAHLTPDQREACAEQLAEFLLAFQRPAPRDAPHNPVRGVPLATRDAAVTQRIEAAELPGELADLWIELRDQQAWTGPRFWLHGDLHPANLVLNDDGLAGVLDFGDLTSGDPATDLAAAWLVFGREGRRIFIDRVNSARPTDGATWQRARGWALCMASAMAAASDDNPDFKAMGLTVLDAVLTDEGPKR